MSNNVTPACTKRFQAPTAPGGRPKAAHTKLLFFHDLSDAGGEQVVVSSDLLLTPTVSSRDFAVFSCTPFLDGIAG